MNSTKYIGMDVHQESISIAVMNAADKLVMECVIETKASTVLQFIQGQPGDETCVSPLKKEAGPPGCTSC